MVKKRVQIVEDEEIVASDIELTLVELGYSVTSIVNSGEDAVKKAEEDKPDIILMDIQLAGKMDGIEAARRIYSQYDIPVVYLTAHSDQQTLKRATETDPFGYIIKPFEDRDLYSNIEIALHKHEIHRNLNKMAYFDSLTGLPNRNVFYDRLDQLLKNARRCNRIFALLFLDLDSFKPVNDNFGHHTGDRLLQEVAQRLEKCVRKSDTVARIGGDEFNILLSDLSSMKDVEVVAQKIIVQLNEPFDFKEHICSIGVSIGISIYPSDGADSGTLIKNADASMYAAKKMGGNQYFFNSQDDITMEHLIEHAVQFLIRNEASLNQGNWTEFIHTLQKEGLDISERIELNIRLLLESLKAIYESGQSLDFREVVSTVTGLSVEFVKKNRGKWSHFEWEGHLSALPGMSIKVTERNKVYIGNVLEVTKALYLIMEQSKND